MGILSNETVKKSASLLISTVGNMLALLVVSYFLTNNLSEEQYGNYSLMLNMLLLAQVVLNFGFFYSLGRKVAQSDSIKITREYLGVSLFLVSVFYIVMNISLVLFVVLVPGYDYLLKPMLYIMPVNWAYVMITMSEQFLQATKKIYSLSVAKILPKILFMLAVIFAFDYLNEEMEFYEVLFIELGAMCLVYATVIWRIKPMFSNFRLRLKELYKANKEYGTNIYIGALCSLGVTSLSAVLISYFEESSVPVGFHNLALQLATPIALLPNILGTVLFRDFVRLDRITKKIYIALFSTSIVCLIGITIVAAFVIVNLYGEAFLPSVELLYYLVFASFFYGIADLFNKFLQAKGLGKELRNTSFIVGAVLLTSNLILMNYYGVTGASIARIISGVCYVLVTYYYYLSYIRAKQS